MAITGAGPASGADAGTGRTAGATGMGRSTRTAAGTGGTAAVLGGWLGTGGATSRVSGTTV